MVWPRGFLKEIYVSVIDLKMAVSSHKLM